MNTNSDGTLNVNWNNPGNADENLRAREALSLMKKSSAGSSFTTFLTLLERQIKDERTLLLLKTIISSFMRIKGSGIPLGNVTSQLFANIYLAELDRFVKHGLRASYSVRYCDDFVIVHHDRRQLIGFIPLISIFLRDISISNCTQTKCM